MSWIFDKPLVSLSDINKVEQDKALWEAEDLGGITEDNNGVPTPVVFLVVLTVLTAFAITFPLWGQRPTAAIYADYVKAMDKPEIQAIQSDAAAIERIISMSQGSQYNPQQERHPVTMDDLRLLKPQIDDLMKRGVDLKDYTVVGKDVILANFEGNYRADGTRERQQPWWDKGYTIDIFYLSYFFLFVFIIIKRLPPATWVPRHGHESKIG
jgi:hypothetical protein